MSDRIYIPPVKHDGQALEGILRQSPMYRSYSADGQVRMRAIIPLIMERELGVF